MLDYCASKFAAIGFAESIDMEMRTLRKTGVKTTIVCPFAINTGMFDGVKSKWPRLLPVLDPEYVAERIISAVRQNQEMLVIPRILYVLHFLRRRFNHHCANIGLQEGFGSEEADKDDGYDLLSQDTRRVCNRARPKEQCTQSIKHLLNE
ncbi:hypothetical protein IHE44_0000998 [Lamprotornis superbus]|uniref:Uncharacterized protein n=1 Tax=Lamprotornis superbus TaxID=245042 RepID=A0A835NWJ8_9PASS|nr:hypothetical protein IHE44_0000998 [Lamprotornis superbus]